MNGLFSIKKELQLPTTIQIQWLMLSIVFPSFIDLALQLFVPFKTMSFTSQQSNTSWKILKNDYSYIGYIVLQVFG